MVYDLDGWDVDVQVGLETRNIIERERQFKVEVPGKRCPCRLCLFGFGSSL